MDDKVVKDVTVLIDKISELVLKEMRAKQLGGLECVTAILNVLAGTAVACDLPKDLLVEAVEKVYDRTLDHRFTTHEA